MDDLMDGWPEKSQSIKLEIGTHFDFHSNVLNINLITGKLPRTILSPQ
jgi:hypothetical protein